MLLTLAALSGSGRGLHDQLELDVAGGAGAVAQMASFPTDRFVRPIDVVCILMAVLYLRVELLAEAVSIDNA